MKSFFRIFCACLFLLLPFSGKGQDGFPRFRQFGLAEGLSTSSVTAICQDNEGKIWVGTHDGLNCLYGTFFKTWYQDRTNPHALNQSAISDLLCDRNGILWIATYGGGLNCLNPVTQTFVPVPLPLKNKNWNQANCLAEDKQGRIWIGFYEGLLIYNPADGSVQTFDRIPGTQRAFPILEIAFDETGNAFLATPFEGMFALTTKKVMLSVPFEQFQKEPNGIGFFHRIYSRKQGILACSQSGPLYFRIVKNNLVWEKSTDLPDKEILAWLKDSQSRTWLPAANSELILLNKDSKPVPVGLPYKGRYPGDRISEMVQDKWGGVWIGSTNGLSYTHPQLSKFSSWSFDTRSQEEGLKIVWSIYSDDDRNFFLGSERGLFLFNKDKFSSIRIPFADGKREKVVYSFLKTSTNRLLAGTSQGIFEIIPEGNGHLAKRVFDQVDGVISAMKELPDGDLLIGTYDDRGVYRLDAFGRLKQHFLKTSSGNENLINNSVNCFQVSSEGKIWIGTDEGFSLYDPASNKFDNSIFELLPKDSKYSSLIYGIADLDQQLWIGTFGSGILVFDKQLRSFKQLGIKEGMPNESVYQVIQKGDEIWASTNKGLCLINRKSCKIRVFTEGDGLQSNEFNHFASFINPKTKTVYFGGLEGFDEVSRIIRPENFNPPRVVISSARLLGDSGEQLLPLDGKPWKLNYRQQNIEVEFAALNYLMPEKNRFAYVLSSPSMRSGTRIPLGEKTKITLTNLLPGEYKLQIFGANNEGIWSAKPYEMDFEIEPPFWQTSIFRILVGLLIIGSLLLIFRLYLKARLRDQTLIFEKKEAVRLERNRISAEMHDDLGSGLTSIKMLSELLNLRTDQQPPPELQKIAIRSDELVESLNTIVWALNDRNDQLEPMVAYLRSFIRSQFEEYQMELQMEASVSPELAQWEIQGELRRNIFLIVKESIHNIFKHSGADLAKVRIVANSDTLDIWLEDNGKGMTKEEHEIFGNGLKNLKERAISVGGTISFTSETGFRTHFHLPLYNVRVI